MLARYILADVTGNRRELDRACAEELHSEDTVILQVPLDLHRTVRADSYSRFFERAFLNQKRCEASQRINLYGSLVRIVVIRAVQVIDAIGDRAEISQSKRFNDLLGVVPRPC